MAKKTEDNAKVAFTSINEVLFYIQQNIIAPKNQYNEFGKYSYRDAEDILEAAKKIMPESAILTISDDVIYVPCEYELSNVDKTEKHSTQKSSGRVYIKAVATLLWGGFKIETSAFAREEMSKKGMDASQVTAATSSYARKIALNGLLMIDDTKDEDKHSKVTKKERDDAALMQKTGADNIHDAEAMNALGGAIVKNIDRPEQETMHKTALTLINACATLEKLGEIWKKHSKGWAKLDTDLFEDIEQAKEQAKDDLTKGAQ